MKSQVPIAAKPIPTAAANGTATVPISVAHSNAVSKVAPFKQPQQQQQLQGFIQAPFYQLYMNTSGKQVSSGGNPMPQMPKLQPQQPIMQQNPQPQIKTAQSQTPTLFSATPTAGGQLIIVPLNTAQTPSVDYNQQIMINFLNQQKLLNQQKAQQQQQKQQAVEYNELKKQYEEALMKNNKLEYQTKKEQMNYHPNKKSPAKMILPKTMANISPKINTFNSKQDELNTSSGSHKKIDDEEESNTSQSPTTENNVSTTSNPTTNTKKKRGRPRLYEMNPTTGKSLKGRLITTITSQKQEQPSFNPAIQMIANPAYTILGQTPIVPSMTHSLPPQPSERPTSTDSSRSSSSSVTSSSEEEISCDESPTVSKESINDENKENTNSSTTTGTKKPSINTNFESPKTIKITTHKVEGYILKESSKPFPLITRKNGATSTNEIKTTANSTMIVDGTPSKSQSTPACNNVDVKPDTENKSPSKRHHKHGDKHHHHHHRSRSRTNMDGEPIEPSESVIAPILNNMSLLSTMPSSSSLDLPPGDPTEWNCDDVYRFVSSVAGVQVANQFKMQDIDGSALSFIQSDHLVNTMQVKLGPALKIIGKFNEVKTRFAAAAARQQLNLSSH